MFFSRTPDGPVGDLRAIITIGSARVTGSLVSRRAEGGVAIHYTTVSVYPHQDTLDTQRFTKGMVSALLEVAMDLAGPGAQTAREVSGLRGISTVECVLAAPWFVAQTRKVSMRREESFPVHERVIHELLQEEVAAFRADCVAEGSPYLIDAQQASVMDAEVIRTELNGYATAHPEGKEATTLTLTAYVSLIDRNILQQVRDVLGKSLNADEPVCRSATLASFRGIEGLLMPTRDYTILEVHGEVTDVSLITDGILLESSSFPLGTSNLVRHVATTLDRRQEDVAARLTLTREGKAERDSEEAKLIEKAAFDAIGEWVDGLYRALKRLSEGRPVPQTTYLLVDPDWEALYSTALKEQAFELFTFSDRPFSVVGVDAQLLARHSQVREHGRFVPLTILAALTPPAG
ncbi:hypothetical protein GVX82_05040 [Patescibacteria group bacterium]|jgi:hypothetical protein|nr:hypothetical protein [Patescibacteria group bacterium]